MSLLQEDACVTIKGSHYRLFRLEPLYELMEMRYKGQVKPFRPAQA